MSKRHLMKGLAVFLVVVLCFGLVGCGRTENSARTPFASDGYQGEDSEKIISALKDAGFMNITTETMLTYSNDKAGTVGKVTIDGKHSFLLDSVYENDVPVVVAYYTTLDEGEQEAQEKPQKPEAEPERSADQDALEVTFDIEVTGEEGKPVFAIETNLPDGTELDLSLLWDDLFNYEDQTAVVKDGKAQSKPFTDNGGPLSGYSAFGITMFPANQPESVRAVVGEQGEHLTGPMVVTVDNYSYVWMEKRFDTEQGEQKQGTNISESDMKAIIESALATGFGDTYSVSLNDAVYTVNTWQDGLATLTVLAQSGNSEAITTWNQITQSTVDASESLQKLLENNGLGDHSVVVNIVNDANKENVLLTVIYGAVIYDCVS